jgi:hypothetical protein
VRLFSVAVTVSEPEEPLEDAEPERELATLVEVVMLAELAADAEAELALLTDDSMLDRIELAAELVEAWLDKDETNAELLDGLRLVAVNVVVATGLPAVEVDPPLTLQMVREMRSAAASLHMAEEVQDILNEMTKSKERRRNEGDVDDRKENPRRRCWPVHIYAVQVEGFQLAVMGG